MTALPSQITFLNNTAQVAALCRAKSGTPDYWTALTSDMPQKALRALTPLEQMYAYFGSDETTA